MVFRSWVRGTSVKGAPSDGGTAIRGAAGAGAAAAARAVGVPSGRLAAPGSLGAAPSRSRSTMRPSGPDPATPPRSMPRSAAMRRASGDALIRPAVPAIGVEAAVAAGATASGRRTVEGGGTGDSAAAEAGAAGGIDVGRAPVGVGRVAGSCTGAGLPFSTGSPGSPISATSSDTGTVAPAGTTCLSSVPAARATSSITALSVSTSAKTSPTATVSPSRFFHSTRRPSSIVGESASITTLVGIGSVEVEHRARRGDHLAGIDFRGALELLVVGHGDVGTGHADHRSVELVECLALNGVRHLRADAREGPSFLGHHTPVRLRHRLEQGRGIERTDGPEVEHFGVDLFARQGLRRLERDRDGL